MDKTELTIEIGNQSTIETVEIVEELEAVLSHAHEQRAAVFDIVIPAYRNMLVVGVDEVYGCIMFMDKSGDSLYYMVLGDPDAPYSATSKSVCALDIQWLSSYTDSWRDAGQAPSLVLLGGLLMGGTGQAQGLPLRWWRGGSNTGRSLNRSNCPGRWAYEGGRCGGNPPAQGRAEGPTVNYSGQWSVALALLGDANWI